MSLEENKAWSILTEDEQTSLALIHSYGKSTWEAGSIMKRTHYKFLEIKVRAQMLFQIFDKQITKYGELFPEGTKILPLSITTYFRTTIEDRVKPKEAIKLMLTKYKQTEHREEAIKDAISQLSLSTNPKDKDLLNLIMDFDRVNAHRILPKSLQERSVYKRRNKTRYRRFLKIYTQLPEFTVLMLIDKYELSPKSSSPRFYLPLISSFLDSSYMVIPVRDNKDDAKVGKYYGELERTGLFLFQDERDAIDFAKLVSSYFHEQNNTAKTGQKFWPLFRDIMEKAMNYDIMDNIMLGREKLPEIMLKARQSKRDKKLN